MKYDAIWLKIFYPIISSCRASGFIFIFSYTSEYISLFLINIYKIIQSSFLSVFNEINKNIKKLNLKKSNFTNKLKTNIFLKADREHCGFNLLNTWPLEPR